jgi:predicted DNA-binding transcriptional regulator AlpA
MAAPVAEASHRNIDAREVGKRYGFSWRTVYRYADAGLIPWGTKVGSLRRWDAAEIDEHIRNGCPPVRKVGRK